MPSRAVFIPAQYTPLGTPAVTWRVVWFAAAASGLVMTAGLVPAGAAWRISPTPALTPTAPTESRMVRALRRMMIATQSAVAVVLLVGAAMFVRSYIILVTQDAGFSGDTYAVRAVYPERVRGEALRTAVQTTVDHLRRLSGISGAAAIASPLVENLSMGGASSLNINGHPVPRARAVPVTPAFFDTMRVRLLSGRLPSSTGDEHAAVVNATLAATCCPGASPLGRVIVSGPEPVAIVGVIGDIYDNALDQRPLPRAYVPLQTSATGLSTITYVLRVEHVDIDLAARVEHEISAVDRDAAPADGSTLHERLRRSITDRSFATLTVGFFAVAALAVSAAGLFGVISFAVARRTREIAIRRAIGASASHVRMLVARDAASAAGAGALVGLTAGTWLSQLLGSLLYGISPGDPPSLVAAVLAIVAVVVFAAWIPARRALRLSPTIALGTE